MKCPICKEALDYHQLLESYLPAYRCRQCEGIWISAREYLRWLQQQPTLLPEKPAAEADLHLQLLHLLGGRELDADGGRAGRGRSALAPR